MFNEENEYVMRMVEKKRTLTRQQPKGDDDVEEENEEAV